MTKSKPVPLRMPATLQKDVSAAAALTQLKDQEVMCQAMKMGLPLLVARLGVPSRISNVKPFPKGTLARIYRRPDPDWDKVEAAAYRAQPKPDVNA